MRKLLLKLANRIYLKYGFKEIYTVMKTTLKHEATCVDVLKVELHKRQSLTSYLSEKLRNKK